MIHVKMPQPTAHSPQPTAHSPQPTAHSPQPTAHRLLSWKVLTKGSLLFSVCLTSFLAEQAFSRCVYETSARPSDTYLACYSICQGETHWDGSDGTNHLDCTNLHLDNYCARYCADADRQSCPSDTEVGNPINIADGSKVHRETDFQGTGIHPLKIERFYNSAVKMPDGNFGVKWQDQSNAKIVAVRKPRAGNIDEKRTFTLQRLGGDYISFSYDLSADNGNTVPIKRDVDFSMTIYNYSVDGIPQVIELAYNNGNTEVYEFNLDALLATNRYESKLLWRQNRNLQTHSFTYDANGNVETVRDDFGNQLNYTYYAGTGQIETITAMPGNRVFRYDYDEIGNLQHVYYPSLTPDTSNSPFKTYLYENTQFPHHLTGIIDENGNRYAWYEYDNNGKAILSKHAGDADLTRVEYGATTTQVLNANGKETKYTFTQVGSGATAARRIISVKGEATLSCIASNSTVTCDANGFKDQVTDGRGFVTDYDHNAKGQEIRRTEALQKSGNSLAATESTQTIETDWYPSGLVKEIREPGKTTKFVYIYNKGTDGPLASRTELDTTSHATPYSTNGQSRTWTYRYTFHDTPTNTKLATITVDGPRTDVDDTTVQYIDPQGRINRVEKALSANTVLTTEITEFTAEGLPKTIVDPNGTVTQLAYTPRGWLKSRTVVTPQGNVTTTYAYDLVGQVTQVTLPTGTQLNYQYDAAHRLQAISTQDNERIEYELTAQGAHRIERIVSSSGSLRRIVHQEFDDLGRLWQSFGVQDQVIETNQYDENGNLVLITDAYQQPIFRAFDGLNRLRSVTERDTGATQYEYNAQNQLVSITDPNGLTTSWVVDGFGRKIQETSPDRGKTVYQYDLADNLIKVTDARNSVTQYAWDAQNRLTGIQYPSSAQDNVSLIYDETTTQTSSGSITHKGKGRLTSATIANGDKIYWAYDALGNLTHDIRTQSNATFQTTYSYNLAGQLTTLTYPSGRELSYGYDNKGRIHQLRSRTSSTASWATLAKNLSYEPFGPLTGFTWGNGLTETLSYDTHYQPETIQIRSGSTDVRNLQYGFNLANELDHLTDAKTPARSQLFSYDPNGRLNQAQGQYGTLAYQYDLTGNRVSQAQTNASDGQNFTESYQYPANTHHLTQVNASGQGGQNRSFQYSAAGNLTKDERYTYVYNDANRLTKIFSGPAVIAEYRYNHLGERISKTADGKTTQFVYGPNHQLLAEHHQDGTPIRDYVYLGNKLLAMVDADTATNPDTGTKADLAITLKGATGNSVKQPDGCYQVTYTVNVQNAGGSAAENVLLTNTFPATDVNLVSYTASQGTCTEDASSCDLGTISAGQTATVTLIANKGKKAKENFSASVTTNSEESNTDNNSATAAFGGAFGLWIMAFLTAMLGLRRLTAKRALNRKNTISTACLLLCGLSLMGANTSQAEQIYYVHTDHLNTPTLVTDSNKTVVWEGVRKPFGEIEEITNTVRQPIRFPGQYFDGETGLSYNLMRDYDARVGRYIQADGIGLAGGSSLYGYAGQNPVAYYDPNGQAAIALPGLGFGLGVGFLYCAATPSCLSAWLALMDRLGSPNDSAASDEKRQSDYVRAKSFCDTPPPAGGNDCATLSRQIDHAEQCISLYEDWDNMWLPGRHNEKIQSWRNRLINLKEEHHRRCTNKCP
ncbi:probable Rhs family protein [gamma proteobacterium HdN1]|nr:probable Rhs family protein [gamma proteobacterium HdN1]